MKNEDIKERRKQIAMLIQANQNLSIDELAESVKASTSTVRRDVEWLTLHNRISRHGGNYYMSDVVYEGFEIRANLNRMEKQRVGVYAASLIEEGDCIYVGAGTTMRQFALSLVSREDIQSLFVVSSAINVASIIAADPRFEVLLLPGLMTSQDENLVCVSHTFNILKEFRFSKCIAGTAGITVTGGFMMPKMEFAEVTRAAIQQSSEVIVLTDHSKFGVYSKNIVCSLDEVDKIIVDRHSKIEAFIKNEPEMAKKIEMV